MFYFKACPKCRGDLYKERNDFEDEELYCIQCGYRWFAMPAVATIPLATSLDPVAMATWGLGASTGYPMRIKAA